MGRTLATMITMTTYGSWLRGDGRKWVDEGIVYPPDPILEANDEQRMKHAAFRFAARDLMRIGQLIGESLVARKQQQILAMTVQTWHVHYVVSATRVPISDVVKCAKDAARFGMRVGRPIWADGYDKRFCFDTKSVRNRVAYVERHNTGGGRPAKPWSFIVPLDI